MNINFSMDRIETFKTCLQNNQLTLEDTRIDQLYDIFQSSQRPCTSLAGELLVKQIYYDVKVLIDIFKSLSASCQLTEAKEIEIMKILIILNIMQYIKSLPHINLIEKYAQKYFNTITKGSIVYDIQLFMEQVIKSQLLDISQDQINQAIQKVMESQHISSMIQKQRKKNIFDLEKQIELIEKNKIGQQIIAQLEEMKSFGNLLEYEIQKYILHYFIQIYEKKCFHDLQEYQSFIDHQPQKFFLISQIKEKIIQQQRMTHNLQKTFEILQPIQNNHDQDNPNCQNLKKYNITIEQIFRAWQHVQSQLKILDIYLLKSLVKVTEDNIQNIKDKNIALFLGPTGVGKTTIILRLLGYELKQIKIKQLPTLIPIQPLKEEHCQLLTSPQVKSTTRFIFSAKVKTKDHKKEGFEIYLCDSPGFFDTEGIVVDIANGIGMINAIKCAKTVKPVVVISQKMIGQKFQGIKQLGKILSNLFAQYPSERAGSVLFIFNKFKNQQEFDRLLPGIISILNNLSPNDELDEKYINYLRDLVDVLKENDKILKFDPKKTVIQQYICLIKENPIPNPSQSFNYSFSQHTQMAIQQFLNCKSMIIHQLIGSSPKQAAYHTKQIKDFTNLLQKENIQRQYEHIKKLLMTKTREMYGHFSNILEEGILKNNAASSQILQAKQIYSKIKQFSCFTGIDKNIQLFGQEDMNNLIASASQQLYSSLKKYVFSYNSRYQCTKLMNIIRTFSSQFDSNLIQKVEALIKQKHDQKKKEINKILEMNAFAQFFKIQEQYQCLAQFARKNDNHEEKQYSKAFLINSKYQEIKRQSQQLIKDITSSFKNLKEQNVSLLHKVQDLTRNCRILTEMQHINISPIIQEERFSNQIMQKLQRLIENNTKKCQELICSTDLSQQIYPQIKMLKRNIQTIISQEQIKQNTHHSIQLINRLLSKNIEKSKRYIMDIMSQITQGTYFHHEVNKLDLNIYRINNLCKLLDFADGKELQSILDDFYVELGKFITKRLTKKAPKLSLKGSLDKSKIINFIETQNEIESIIQLQSSKLLMNTFEDLKQNTRINFAQIKEQYRSQLVSPYQKIKSSIDIIQSLQKLAISKKIINELNNFIEIHDQYKLNLHQKIYQRQTQFESFDTRFFNLFSRFQYQLSQILQDDNIELNSKTIMQYLTILQLILESSNIRRQLQRCLPQNKFQKYYQSFKQKLSKIMQDLIKKCYQMRYFQKSQKIYLQLKQNCNQIRLISTFIETENNINQMQQQIDNKYLKLTNSYQNQLNVIISNTEINYESLQEFYKQHQSKAKIVEQIKQKIKKFDESCYSELQRFKTSYDEMLYSEQIMKYTKSIFKALQFCYAMKSGTIQNLPIKLLITRQYLLSIVEPIDHYLNEVYQEAISKINNLQMNVQYMSKVQIFFDMFEKILNRLIPQKYCQNKNHILAKQNLTPDFNINLPSFENKSIKYKIMQVFKMVNDQLKRDFTNLIDIFNPNCRVYYNSLTPDQQKVYKQRTIKKFQESLCNFRQNSKSKVLMEQISTKLKKIVASIPDRQIRNKCIESYEHAFDEINKQIEAFISSFKSQIRCNEYNFQNILRLMKQIDESEHKKLHNELINNIIKSFRMLNFAKCSRMQQIFQYDKLLINFGKQFHNFASEYKNQDYKNTVQLAKSTFWIEMVQHLQRQLKEIFINIDKSLNSEQKITYEHHEQNQIQEFYIYLMEDCPHKEYISSINNIIEIYYCGIFQMLYKGENNFSSVDKILELGTISTIQLHVRRKIKLIKYLSRVYDYMKQKMEKDKHVSKQKQNKLAQIIGNDIRLPILQFHNKVINIKEQMQSFSISNLLLGNFFERNKRFDVLFKFCEKIKFISNIQDIYRKYNLYQMLKIDNLQNTYFKKLQEDFKEQARKAGQQLILLKQDYRIDLTQRLDIIFQMCTSMGKKRIKYEINIQFMLDLGRELEDKLINLLNQFKQKVKLSIDSVEASNSIKLFSIIIAYKKIIEKIPSKKEYLQAKFENDILPLISSNRKLLDKVNDLIYKNIQLLEARLLSEKYYIFKAGQQKYYYQRIRKPNSKYFEEFVKSNTEMYSNFSSYLDRFNSVYKRQFQQIKERYIQNPTQETVIAVAKNIKENVLNLNIFEFLGKLFGLHSIIQQRKANSSIQFAPHISQIFAICLIVENASIASTKSSLLEMFTGQGKSLVIAGAACYLALRGNIIELICYSKYLIQRDRKQFQQLFQLLQIKEKIVYNTFAEFCQTLVMRLYGIDIQAEMINESNKSFLDKIASCLKNKFWSTKNSFNKNIILLDQIDVLFSQEYEGQVYQHTFKLKDQKEDKFILFLFQVIRQKSKTEILTCQKIRKIKKLNLPKRFEKFEKSINNHINMMIDHALDSQQIQKCVSRFDGNIANFISDKFNGYHQMFALFVLKQRGKISIAQLNSHLSICLTAAQFSYSELPNFFNKIFGITGTLRCLSQTKKNILKDKYGIKNFYEMPSLYQKKECIEQKVQFYLSEARLFLQIIQYIKSNTQKKQGKQFINASIIIFFENYQISHKFAASDIYKKMIDQSNWKINFLNDQNFCIFEQLTSKIQRVTIPGTITISTKQYTRGIDYKDYSLQNGLTVIQTYLPQSKEDLVQTKGRTARAGKLGRYKLFLPEYIKTGHNINIVKLQDLDKLWENNEEKPVEKFIKLKGSLQRHAKTLKAYQSNSNLFQHVEELNVYQKRLTAQFVIGIHYNKQSIKTIEHQLVDAYQKVRNKHKKSNKLVIFRLFVYYNHNNKVQSSETVIKSSILNSPLSIHNFFDGINNQKPKIVKQNRSSLLFLLKQVKKLTKVQKTHGLFIITSNNDPVWQLFFKKQSSSKQGDHQREQVISQLSNVSSKKLFINFVFLTSKIEKIEGLQLQQYRFNYIENEDKTIQNYLSLIIQKKIEQYFFEEKEVSNLI